MYLEVGLRICHTGAFLPTNFGSWPTPKYILFLCTYTMKQKERKFKLPQYVINETLLLIKDYFTEQNVFTSVNLQLEGDWRDTFNTYPISASGVLVLNSVIQFQVNLMCFSKNKGAYSMDIIKPNGLRISFGFRADGWNGRLEGETILSEFNRSHIHKNLMHIVIYSFALLQFKKY